MEENKKELEAAKIEDWDQDVVGGAGPEDGLRIKGMPGGNGKSSMDLLFTGIENGGAIPRQETG